MRHRSQLRVRLLVDSADLAIACTRRPSRTDGVEADIHRGAAREEDKARDARHEAY